MKEVGPEEDNSRGEFQTTPEASKTESRRKSPASTPPSDGKTPVKVLTALRNSALKNNKVNVNVVVWEGVTDKTSLDQTRQVRWKYEYGQAWYANKAASDRNRVCGLLACDSRMGAGVEMQRGLLRGMPRIAIACRKTEGNGVSSPNSLWKFQSICCDMVCITKHPAFLNGANEIEIFMFQKDRNCAGVASLQTMQGVKITEMKDPSLEAHCGIIGAEGLQGNNSAPTAFIVNL